MATAQHSKAAEFVWLGIFNNLDSFAELESRINRILEEKDRGDVFEIFIEAYLATQPITQRVRHWVVGGIPLPLRERYGLPADATGIDGIYEARDGTHVAYQVKYRQRPQLTYAEVAPFLGLTERFTDRVIFTNASTLSAKASKRARWVNRETFLELSSVALGKIEAWLKSKPLPVLRALPDPNYQTQALAEIKTTLEKCGRATAVMACGTGKTLIALWAAEQAEPKTVLVLVPSITLLSQTLREWSEQTGWGNRFSYLCVCSDKTVGLKDDALNTDKSAAGFRIDTDPKIVRQFLERQTHDIKIVFSTYHSAPIVGEGSRGLPPFDIAIFDEAHKTTSYEDGLFSYALADKNIRIRKRLFLTATPRHIDIRHRNKEGEFKVQSMDDAAVYGPRAHTFSFAAAAKKKIICRYKVIISLIDKRMVSDFARKHGITLVKRDEISARWVANLIALKQAVEKVGASKIITFHSRVKTADEFAAHGSRGIADHLDGYDVRHVNGSQSSVDRGDIMRAFADAPKSILTNARCLTEGVNIPAVDMVAFIDPRQSRVDIAQAVGRAMRKPRGKTTKTVGYVVVPLFAGMNERDSLEEAVHSEKFDVVADVLNALQEHDEELVEIVSEIRERKGRGEPFDPRRLNEKAQVIGPLVELERLAASIAVEIGERIGISWDEWYGVLQRFKAREGHCRVPTIHIEGIYRLGGWAGSQRSQRDSMPVERRERLEALEFEWDPNAYAWEEGFAVLARFKAREGHCLVHRNHIEGTYKLGHWVGNQRAQRDCLPVERRQRLEALGFDWDPIASAWEEGFAALERFKAKEGHCWIAPRHLFEGSYTLGRWVVHQRVTRDSLPVERRQRLEALGFEFDPFVLAWEEGYAALDQFKAREGHCRVPNKHLEGTYTLGRWVNKQRMNKNRLSHERRQRLEALGFIWDAIASAWEEGFAALERFKAREHHCRVSGKHLEGTFTLGRWVNKQRMNKDHMSHEYRQRLVALGFEWDILAVHWEEGFATLEQFKAREGHCRVPNKHLEGAYRLGGWVARQRSQRDTMPVERRQRLDALVFVWRAG